MAKKYFFRNRREKIKLIGESLAAFFSGKVLDVGCNDGYLKEVIRAEYTGIDKSGKPDISLDVSSGLPFEAGKFDTVAAFDLLEHVDNIHFVFDELCRVSKKYVIITLPNAFEWRFRLAFLFGKSISGKYGLSEKEPEDRHRWIFSFREAGDFVRNRGEARGFQVIEETAGYYRYNKFLPRLVTKAGSLLGKKFQNLFASHYVAVLEKK